MAKVPGNYHKNCTFQNSLSNIKKSKDVILKIKNTTLVFKKVIKTPHDEISDNVLKFFVLVVCVKRKINKYMEQCLKKRLKKL